MIFFLFKPLIFYSMLATLFVVSMIVLFIALRQDNKYKKLDGLLKEESDSKIELQRNIESLQREAESLKSELSLKEKMYEGLKGQYEEMEKDFEKLSQTPSQPLPSKDKPQLQPNEKTPPEAENLNSDNSILNLLKSINKIQKDHNGL